MRLAGSIVEPLLRPLNGKLIAGNIDFAPVAVMIVLLLARLLIAAPLIDLGARAGDWVPEPRRCGSGFSRDALICLYREEKRHRG